MKVTFLPLNISVEVDVGTSILEAALENGVNLDHNCGGVCACTTCHVIVKRGDDSLSEIDDAEDDRLSQAEGLTLHSRLGCQAVVESGDEDVTVESPNQVPVWERA